MITASVMEELNNFGITDQKSSFESSESSAFSNDCYEKVVHFSVIEIVNLLRFKIST